MMKEKYHMRDFNNILKKLQEETRDAIWNTTNTATSNIIRKTLWNDILFETKYRNLVYIAVAHEIPNE